jgi:very-short-patch-repair endonuclease
MTKRKATISSLNSPNAETLYLMELGHEFGLGEAVLEFEFAKPLHRKFRSDLCWVHYKLIVEIEGGIFTGGRHVRGKSYEQDCIKYSMAAILGYCVLRMTYPMLHDGRGFYLLRLAADKIVCEQ